MRTPLSSGGQGRAGCCQEASSWGYPGRRGASTGLAAGRGSLGGVMIGSSMPHAVGPQGLMSRACPGEPARAWSVRVLSCRGLTLKAPSTCATWAASPPTTAARRSRPAAARRQPPGTVRIRRPQTATRYRADHGRGPTQLGRTGIRGPGAAGRRRGRPARASSGDPRTRIGDRRGGRGAAAQAEPGQVPLPERPHLRALPGLPGRPAGSGGRGDAERRARRRGGGGSLRGRQGPDGGRGGAGPHRGRGPSPGRRGRLRRDGGAHRGHTDPAAPVTDVRPRHRQPAGRGPPGPAGDDGGLPRADGLSLRRGGPVAGRARPLYRGAGPAAGQAAPSVTSPRPYARRVSHGGRLARASCRRSGTLPTPRTPMATGTRTTAATWPSATTRPR